MIFNKHFISLTTVRGFKIELNYTQIVSINNDCGNDASGTVITTSCDSNVDSFYNVTASINEIKTLINCTTLLGKFIELFKLTIRKIKFIN